MKIHLSAFIFHFIILSICSGSMQSTVDDEKFLENNALIEKNAETLQKLQWEIEREQNTLNLDEIQRKLKNRTSNLEKQLTKCEAQTKIQTDNSSTSNLLIAIKNIESSLKSLYEYQIKSLNSKINDLTKTNGELKTANEQYKLQIQSKDNKIIYLETNYSSAASKLQELKFKFEANLTTHKIFIDLKDAEISKLRTLLNQNQIQSTELRTLIASVNQLQSNIPNTEKNNKIKEQEIEIKKCRNDSKVLADSLTSSQGKLSSCNVERQTQQTDITRLNIEVSKIQTNLNTCKEQLRTSAARIQYCSKNLGQCRKELTDNKLAVNNREVVPSSCVSQSQGQKQIKLPDGDPFDVFCDDNIFGTGWMIIHRRYNGKQNFNMNWLDYVNGFGNLYREFFIGLKHLHIITNSQPYELNICLTLLSGEKHYVHYDDFKIGNYTTCYKLESIGLFTGTLEDALRYNENMPFASKDYDNTRYKCTQYGNGGWWYPDQCGISYLNGEYSSKMTWGTKNRNTYVLLKKVVMAIRPKPK